MKHLTRFLFPALLLLASATPRASAAPILFSWDLNFNGALTGYPLPPEVTSTLDWDPIASEGTGLGTVTVTFVDPGQLVVGTFFDHEFDVPPDNDYLNEYGAVHGAPPPAGLSWEIDEPGYLGGNIHDNFEDSALDNTNSVPSSAPNDVSMALLWRFLLLEGETAVARFTVSQTAPSSGFYLSQTDSASGESLYLFTSLDITPTGPGPGTEIPEPGAILLFLAGGGVLLAMRAMRRIARHGQRG